MLKRWLVVVWLAAALLAAGCGTIATPIAPVSPTSVVSSRLEAGDIPADPSVVSGEMPGTPTPNGSLSVSIPTLVPTTVTALVDDAAARGMALFNGTANCIQCHAVAGNRIALGPSLEGVASRAGDRVPGLAAADYIRTSIMNPEFFIVPGANAGVMPPNFAAILTTDQINDLIAYLMTL